MRDSLPQSLAQLIGQAQWHQVHSGESDAQVYRLEDETGSQYLKISAVGSSQPVLAEAERLRWLQGRVPVAQVLYAGADAHSQYLLTDALPGVMPYHDGLDWNAEARIRFVADAVRRFHSLPAADCPFHMTLDAQIAAAQRSFKQGAANAFILKKDYGERSPQEVYTELLAHKPAAAGAFVVGHGDLYPVNMLADPATQALTGYLDVGRMGVMDGYTDLARIANAILWHYGEDWLLPFFQHYGIEKPDWERLRFYRLLSVFA